MVGTGRWQGMTTITTTAKDDLNLARNGDRAAFGRLVKARYAAALALACRLCGNPDDAEDAVQDALLKTWRHLPELRDGRVFASWFLAIVYRQCLDGRRRRDTRRRHEDAVRPGVAVGVTEWAQANELMACVREGLDALPARQAAALHLRVFEQLGYGDLALVLGLTRQSARVTVARARRRLRALLPEELLGP